MGTAAAETLILRISDVASLVKGQGMGIEEAVAVLEKTAASIKRATAQEKLFIRESETFNTSLSTISQDTLNSYHSHIALGNIYFGLEDYDRARSMYVKAKDVKVSREVFNNLGVVTSRMGDHDSSISYYNQSIELQEDNGQSWFNLGKAYFRKGSIQDAIRSFKRSVELEPKNKSAWNNLGVCFRMDGRIEEAVESYDRALAIDSSYVWAWDNKGNALMEVGRSKEALKCFDTALKIDPNYESAIKNRQECKKRISSWSVIAGKVGR